MLFTITATETVQLNPADFHSRYEDALLKILQQRLYDKISYKYGRVLAIKFDQNQKINPPLLLTHYGVACFKLQFQAIVEKLVSDEPARGLLIELSKLDEDHACLYFQVSSQRLSMVVSLSYYNYSNNYLSCKDHEEKYVEELRIGEFYPGIRRNENDFYVLNVKNEDDSLSYDNENEDESNSQINTDSNENEPESSADEV